MKRSHRERALASSFFSGLAALALPFAAGSAVMAITTEAHAQDYTSGGLVIIAKDASGAPVANADVSVKSQSQGITRKFKTDASGAFRASALPAGLYDVTIAKSGFQTTNAPSLAVRAGGESTFDLTVAASTGDDIVVTAKVNRQLDFSQSTKGLTIDLEELRTKIPVARSITQVSLLTPGVVTGSSSTNTAFANQPTIGGSSVAENAFYVNGLNITNFDTYVGGATVPFDFYKSVEVKSGGYPAEFGRATGGVVNAVTKSGGDEFKVNLHGVWEPSQLRDHSPNTFLTRNERSADATRTLTTEVSGPLIADHLFFYVLNQQSEVNAKRAQINTRQYTIDKRDDPFWGGKLDGYITQDHHIEYTYFNTKRTTNRKAFNYSNATNTIGSRLPDTVFVDGGESWVTRYTGRFTDWFTLSAAYGKSGDQGSTLPSDTTSPLVQDDRSGQPITISQQKIATSEVLTTKREFARVDGDVRFSLYGDHHVRVGYDHEGTSLFHAVRLNGPGIGGREYFYHTGSVDDSVGVPDGQDYVEVLVERLGGLPVKGENSSFYAQDSWDLTKQLNLQIGVRNDEFKVRNLVGETPIDLKDNWGARIGVNYDPFGKGNDKISFFYGRTFIPPASNLSFRGADLGFSEFFLAPAGGFVINPTTGVPAALGTQILGSTFGGLNDARCPAGGVGAANAVGCTVSFGVGIAEPAASKTAKGLEATHEDEYILGYTKKMDLWTFGATLTFRELKKVSEDVAMDPYVRAYCTANGIVGCEDIWNDSWQYIVMNPGDSITFQTRGPLPGQTSPKLLSFTAAQLGLPKPKRTYEALELSFDRGFDGKWQLGGSYVLSRSFGNYEGTVLSDNGQLDAGSTILWDFKGLTDNQKGLLPNHHLHQFKLYGAYQVTENLSVGFNGRIISPKHLGCLGVHPTDDAAAAYGASSRYCQGVAIQRGSVFTTDWQKQLDLNARYDVSSKFKQTPGQLYVFIDGFNVLNEKGVTDAEERGDTATGARRTTYQRPRAYQTPRYFRIGFDWGF